MSRSATTPTGRRRLPRRLVRCAAVAAAPLLLAGTVTASAAATAAPQHRSALTAATQARYSAPADTAHQAAAAPAPRTLSLPGLSASSYTVTLITGDQVRLTAAAQGRYSVSVGAGASTSHSVYVTNLGSTSQASSLYALPDAASALIAAGRVDKGVFDLSWLASHGDTGAGARLPLVVQYSGHPSAAALATAAATLPGASVTSTSADSGTADISVDTSHAAAFWAALTGQAPAAAAAGVPGAYRPGVPGPSLAGGIAKVWLAGHQTAAQAQASPDNGPRYTVTETIDNWTASQECDPGTGLCITGLLLFGITGGGSYQSFLPASFICGTTSSTGSCTAYEATYSVPAGVYMAFGFGEFYVDERLQQLDLTVPQFTVAGDTAFTIDVSKAAHITIDTPKASENDDGGIEDYRTLPDGRITFGGILAFWGYQNYWAIPSLQPVTIGTYHFSTALMRGPVPVTMSVVAPERLTLDPVYPLYTNAYPEWAFDRFSGRRTMQLAYAGYGGAQDFAGLAVRGKLVMIGLDPALNACQVQASALENAYQAGAAGVLIDPRLGDVDCTLPVQPTWYWGGSAVTNMPFAAVPAAQATELEALLSKGTVKVTVADSGPAQYLYDLKYDQEGQVPASLQYRVTNQQLADVVQRYYSAGPAIAEPNDDNFALDEYDIFGTEYGLPGPAILNEYIGPVSPDQVHQQSADLGAAVPDQFEYNIFDRGGSTTTEDLLAPPMAPGAVAAPADVYRAQPGKWISPPDYDATLCAFCRQGNTFYPFFYPVAGDPKLIYDGTIEDFDPSSIELYSGGQQIPQTLLGGEFVTYQLPPQRASYRLTAAEDNVSTDWTFSSASPATDSAPFGYPCVGTALGISADPCDAGPLIFLRYNAFTDLSTAVTAPGTHQLQVTPFYQASAPPGAITSLKVWTSTDGGTTWQQAMVTRGHDGTYTATYEVPALTAANGTVSIKAQATDSAGDTVSQVIDNAYNLAS